MVSLFFLLRRIKDIRNTPKRSGFNAYKGTKDEIEMQEKERLMNNDESSSSLTKQQHHNDHNARGSRRKKSSSKVMHV